MTTALVKTFDYPVPAKRLWRALTDLDMMKQWYFPQLRAFKPIVGFRFEFTEDGSEYQKEWKVTRVEDVRTLAHSWAYRGYPGSSEVIFDIIPHEGSSTLRVTQTNLESYPDDPHFARSRFEWGWDNLLGRNLKELLTRQN